MRCRSLIQRMTLSEGLANTLAGGKGGSLMMVRGEDDTCIASGGSEGAVPVLTLPLLLLLLLCRIEDLVDKVAVAIAPDSWSPIGTLTPEQYTVAAISEVWNEQSYIRIDGQARTGHRLRFVVSGRGVEG